MLHTSRIPAIRLRDYFCNKAVSSSQPPVTYTPPHLADCIRAEQAALEARIYFPKAQTLAQQFSQEYSRATFVDGVVVEDGGIFEKAQSMLASGAKKELIVGDEELLIRHHHKVTETFFNA